MTDLERAFRLFVDANPVPDGYSPHLAPDAGSDFLAAIEQRSTTMPTSQLREVSRIERSSVPVRRRWRGPVAAAAAFAIVALVGLGIWLAAADGTTGDAADKPLPTTGPYGLPDFSSDPAAVGDALTAAQNTYDPEVFLSLFAEDAELSFSNQTVSPADIREGVTLERAGVHYQYDRAWARIMNEVEVYSSCVANGNKVICDMTATSDLLKPVLPPVPNQIAIEVLDGKIIAFRAGGVFDPSNEILSDFQDWTYANYPEEAALMWTNPDFPRDIRTEESAHLYLRLGEEYLQP